MSNRTFAAACGHERRALPQLADERFHPRAPPLELVCQLDVRLEDGHSGSVTPSTGASSRRLTAP